jgi:signal transduction histidine kinase/CheY-like chemotaxis protein
VWRELYTVARLTGIALSTSIALVALSAAVAAGGPRVGLTALLVRHDEVGAFARRLVPAAVLLPLALGWAMSALLHAGVVNEPLAIAMMALGLVAGLLAVVWRTGKRLSFALDARLQAERALSASEQSLRESDRQKTDFLATLSHELRNPLAPIRFAIDVMETSTEAAQHARHVLRRQVRHLSRLVDDLLDLTRITRSKLHLDLRPVELRAVVNEAVDATAAELAAQGHQLTVSLPPGQVWLRADADRLVQVLVNLLTNAGRYTPAGGRIAIEALVEGPEIGIVVRDNGRGIAAEDLHRIFDDFVQVGATKHGGLGIGLALVKGLVALHEGRIEASSAGHDQGSTFTVYLTRDYAPQPEPWSAPETAHCSAQRFLVVDDNVDAANTLRDLLASRGHKAAVAYDGVSALRAAAVVRPTVALLDIGLPGMSGYELARHLRRDPELSAVFLVAITGWGQDDDKRQALEAGFDAHLTKPADPEHILQIVAAALDATHGAAGPT